MCLVAAEYLADAGEQDGFSDVESIRSVLSEDTEELSAAIGQWRDDDPQQEDASHNIDEDV